MTDGPHPTERPRRLVTLTQDLDVLTLQRELKRARVKARPGAGIRRGRSFGRSKFKSRGSFGRSYSKRRYSGRRTGRW